MDLIQKPDLVPVMQALSCFCYMIWYAIASSPILQQFCRAVDIMNHISQTQLSEIHVNNSVVADFDYEDDMALFMDDLL